MLPSPVTDLKTFVPAKDPELSKKFYADLGFTINWRNEQIAELQIGSFRSLLQTFYVAEHAGNFMMSLAVDDADAGGSTSNVRISTRSIRALCVSPGRCSLGEFACSTRVIPQAFCGTSRTPAGRNVTTA
jgi:hypothetical protein